MLLKRLIMAAAVLCITAPLLGELFTPRGPLWARVLHGHEKQVFGVAFLNDGFQLATGCKGGLVNYWDSEGLLLHRNRRPQEIFFLHQSPTSDRLYVTRKDGSLEIRTKKDKPILITGHTNYINAVAENPDGRTFATASEDRKLILWTVGGVKLRQLEDHKQAVTTVDYHPKGLEFASGSRDNTIKLWRRNGEFIRSLEGHADYVWSVRFTPDGKYLASCSKDMTVRIWSTETWQTVRTLRGHAGDLWSLAVSPDGRHLATAGRDGIIYIWTLDGKLVRKLVGHRGGIVALAFSRNGLTLASGSLDGTVIIWR